MRGSTPSFTKIAALKTFVASLNTNPESGSQDRDNSWNLSPMKDNQISPSEKETGRSENTVKEDDKNRTQEDKDPLNSVSRAQSFEISTPESKPETVEKRQMGDQESPLMVKENNSGIQFRNINKKFTRMVMTDSQKGTSAYLPRDSLKYENQGVHAGGNAKKN